MTKMCLNTYSSSLGLSDQVLLENSKHDSRKCGKLDVKWTGPYWVSERPPKGCFKLKNGNGAVLKQIFHASRLKPYYPPQRYCMWTCGCFNCIPT